MRSPHFYHWVYLCKDGQLWRGEDEGEKPGNNDHGPRSGPVHGQIAERVADGQIAVETHRGQDERGAGQRHDLTVQQQLAEGRTEHPGLVEYHEQHLDKRASITESINQSIDRSINQN